MKSVDSIETYIYGISKDLMSEKEEIKCKNVTNYIKVIKNKGKCKRI